jgi:hypothetical protein
MSAPEIPFFLITDRADVQQPPDHEPCNDPKAAHAFTSAEKLAAFMNARGRAKWKIDQVADREGVIVAVAELYEQGYREICIDPEADGSGGLLVSLSDLLAAYRK